MSNYFRGDIVIVPFPFTDLSESKNRPAIVISNSKVNKKPDVVLAQITSNVQHDEFSFELKDADVTYSLEGYSEVRCHKIFTASKDIIKKKISSLKSTKQVELFNQITSLLS